MAGRYKMFIGPPTIRRKVAYYLEMENQEATLRMWYKTTYGYLTGDCELKLVVPGNKYQSLVYDWMTCVLKSTLGEGQAIQKTTCGK